MDSRAGSLSLVGGVLALDFANTAGARETSAPIEHLLTAADVVAWAVHAGSIDAATAKRVSSAINADRDMARRLLRHAVQLRDSIHSVGAAIAHDKAPPEADLRSLKDTAQRALAAAEITSTAAGGYGFDFSDAPAEAALLGPIAWSAIDLLAKARFERLKQCPAHDCGWLFLDTSKNNTRRWCDMATCGNRTKATRFRERH
ncbi:MAG TPA: CGNR zinc finger domain-containing protein [Vineibacter sp.]|nr:CGNR zinc finger domain-containing protein [Vineibacter sp.]